jgi:curved DNA-binding protein CbpA
VARPIDDPYRTLGILRGAEPDEIRAAHRRLAKRFHPDGSMGDEQRFLAVQEAYQLLSDPLRRRDWDHRHAAGPMPAQRAPARPSQTRPTQTRPTQTRPTRTGSTPKRPTRPARPQPAPGVRTRTWSAEHIPWWLDFSPREPRDGESAAAPTDRPPDRGRQGRSAGHDEASPAAPGMDPDVFSRSSGAAWSMAARRHFRRAGAEDPPPDARATGTRHTGARADDGPASTQAPTPEERSRP